MSPVLQALLAIGLLAGAGAAAWFLALRRARRQPVAPEPVPPEVTQRHAEAEAVAVERVDHHEAEQIAAIEKAQTADLNADLAALRARRSKP